MEFLKKSIHMDQIGCEEQTQITLEDDVNIADAKPDVYQVVTQQGNVELEEVRASDGHVHVKGVLHFKVLYLADEETHHPACTPPYQRATTHRSKDGKTFFIP